jgi:preprotein translocase subunit SecE
MSADMQPGAVAHGEQRPPFTREPGRRGGLFARIRIYYRETVAELRKVIYPTRSELLNYTLVVLVFVSVMVALVFGLDILFAKFDLFLFGK